MKKIKLLVLIFLLTGCSVQYNLDLDKSLNLVEEVTINVTNQTEIDKIKKYGYLPVDIDMDDPAVYDTKIDGVEYYNIKKTPNKIKFNYTHNNSKYVESYFVRGAYEFVSVATVDDELILSTSKEFKLFELYDDLEEVKVTIHSNYKLIKSNADQIKNNNYTWLITKENAYEKNIYLKLDMTEEKYTFLEKLKNGEYFNIFTTLVIIMFISFVIYLFLKKKSESRDKI